MIKIYSSIPALLLCLNQTDEKLVSQSISHKVGVNVTRDTGRE